MCMQQRSNKWFHSETQGKVLFAEVEGLSLLVAMKSYSWIPDQTVINSQDERERHAERLDPFPQEQIDRQVEFGSMVLEPFPMN